MNRPPKSGMRSISGVLSVLFIFLFSSVYGVQSFDDQMVIMSTYVLCGFANTASIGIPVGGIGILVPEKKRLLAKYEYGVTALIGGTLASMSTAILAGIFF